ncbi:hypothetical protein A7975_18590 [Bacillus sp. FJAT-26390]|nr:hypothetical protein A7975_18590 [Bacillus sp. FJAT-26390]
MGRFFLLQNVCWPVFGTFRNLHPEYEIYDWNRKSQFLDFAFLPEFGRFGLECDDFQSHIKDMDREKHSYASNFPPRRALLLHFCNAASSYAPNVSFLLHKMQGTAQHAPTVITGR